jgi:heat shock protein HspQ
MAHTQPPRDRPWYHVLVDGGTHQTYVAERNLEPDPDPGPINHPRVDEYFSGFDGTVYRPRKRRN